MEGNLDRKRVKSLADKHIAAFKEWEESKFRFFSHLTLILTTLLGLLLTLGREAQGNQSLLSGYLYFLCIALLGLCILLAAGALYGCLHFLEKVNQTLEDQLKQYISKGRSLDIQAGRIEKPKVYKKIEYAALVALVLSVCFLVAYGYSIKLN
jgi:hypothetical protein